MQNGGIVCLLVRYLLQPRNLFLEMVYFFFRFFLRVLQFLSSKSYFIETTETAAITKLFHFLEI